MRHFFSLKFKLVLYTLFLTIASMSTIGLISNNYLHDYFNKNAKKKLYEAFVNTKTQLQSIKTGLLESSFFISENEDIIASLNLIKNYENIYNYQNSIFDEEKKRIINILGLEGKYSTSDHIAIYNTKRELVAFVDREEDVIGYVSYQNAKPLYFAKDTKDDFFRIGKKPHDIDTKLQKNHSSGVFNENSNNKLNMVSIQPIYRDPKDTTSEIVGYIETNRHLSIDDLNKLVDIDNLILNYYFEHNTIKVQHNNHVHTSDIKEFGSLPFLYSKYTYEDLYLGSNEHYFFSAVKIPLRNDFLLLTANINKSELQRALMQSKSMLLTSIAAIVIVTLIISLIILNSLLSVPLKRLLHGIGIITKGDYSHKISIKNNDELGLISQEFNKMAQTIKERESQLDELAHYDVLTKMPNRAMFLTSLENAISRAKRNKTKLAVFFLDLDEFKSINDTLGHNVGDKLLIKVAHNLSHVMRRNDLLARIGGDEFNILIEDLDSAVTAEEIAHKMIEQMSLALVIDDNRMHITGSIGIAIYPDDARDSMTLLKNADIAMYNAKDNGKNRYQFFSQELSVSLENRTKMLKELKEALNKNEFKLYYQPKFSLENGKIYAAEALIRWENPTLGFVTPDQFIPLAEESGEIINIGAWVIEQACKDFAMWEELGLCISQVSVNVSNIQFSQHNIIKTLQNAIKNAGIKPQSLEIEMTESYVYENSNKALEVLHKIREIGIDIAMDDFGTGYSSMSYLKQLPLSRLKIDKSFIDDIPHNDDDVEITKIIIALAKVMGLEITAEGIETQEQIQFLQELECNEGQGYICSKPLPNEQFIELLTNNRVCTFFN